MNVQENVSLAPLTTMKVGGPARYFVENKTIAEVQGAVRSGARETCRCLYWEAEAIWSSPMRAGQALS